MFRVLCLVYGNVLDLWCFKIKNLKFSFFLFFENFVFNVELFKVFVFKDINIFKKNIFCFNINLYNNKIFPGKKSKGLVLDPNLNW